MRLAARGRIRVRCDADLAVTSRASAAPGLESRPLVSIVVRTKDRPYYLREALTSLRHQTYRHLEVIVVEDGPDRSRAVIDEFPDLVLSYVPLGASRGRCLAGNEGLERARGDYCGLLDDDDLLFAEHVETLVGALLAGPGCRAAYTIGYEVQTRLLSRDPLTYAEGPYRIVFRQPFDRALLGERNFLPINAVLFDRGLYLSEGGFDPALEVLEDWDLWLRFARRTDFRFVDRPTFLYRVPLDLELAARRQGELRDYSRHIRAKHGTLPGPHHSSGIPSLHP
jgi:GT2 family glycosyltransferase